MPSTSTIINKKDSVTNRKKQSSALYDPDDIMFSFGVDNSQSRPSNNSTRDFEELDEEVKSYKEKSTLLNKNT
jgi:hypothetical protein